MENRIIKEFKNLRKDVSPRLEWVTLNRDFLLKQVNPQREYKTVSIGLDGYVQMFTQIFRQHLLEPAVVMLLVLSVFLGSSLTINAAFYSLPGDHLYPVKIALEKTHVALVPNEEKQVELKMEFAQKRVAELDKIIQQVNIDPQQKKKKIEAAVKEFRNNVVAVNDHLNRIKQFDSENKISDEDKEQTLRIALSVSSKTEELAKSLDEKTGELPAVEKLEVKEILADAAASVQETSLSAQQLAEDAAPVPAETKKEEGVIEGATIDEATAASQTEQKSEAENSAAEDPAADQESGDESQIPAETTPEVVN